MYLNDKEEKIIDTFLENLDECERFLMILRWKNGGQVLARFDTCFEDEDDNEEDVNFEEYMSFVFEAKLVEGTPPIETYNDFFLINYRNFPDEILVNGKKIN